MGDDRALFLVERELQEDLRPFARRPVHDGLEGLAPLVDVVVLAAQPSRRAADQDPPGARVVVREPVTERD
ncbi:hypothetical protein [Streptomyces sp. NPDC046685]|uniref:hypothetical protein n=1 Tax=Streptomyces sp. NPDC046685 TaxID=3157202 RepID=UPI0033CB0DF4